MIAVLLAAVLAAQGPGALQPGTGIVTGTLKTTDGRPAAGVRVGAVDVEDTSASSLLSVTETDSAGRYRLINVPSGRYYIVAGRLADLRYYPLGADRATAAEITVEAARVRADVNFAVPGGSHRAPQRIIKAYLLPRDETIAYEKLAAEKNLVRIVQLLTQFEREFPKSSRLPEAYVKVSRLFAGQHVTDRALQYAEKAAVRVEALRSEISPNTDPRWTRWVASLESSVQSNLAWVKQMATWQNKALFSVVAPVRKQ